MPSMGRTRLAVASALLALVGLSPGSADADKILGAAGGAFVPYSGDVGWSVLLEMGAELPDERFRLAGELAFQTVSRDVALSSFGAGTGSVETTIRVYQLNAVGRYVLRPGRFTPYVGVMAGLSIIELDDANLTAAVNNPAVLPTTSGVGFAGGVGGIAGIETPIASRDLSLFLEGRAGWEWQINDNVQPVVGDDEFNGVSILMGLRARF